MGLVKMSVILFFIDGLGIGEQNASNPLYELAGAEPLAIFQDQEPTLVFDGVLSRTDARLGVEGRPQSASGQTTILTGINAPKALGYHKQGFPNEALRNIIRENSIFLRLINAGVSSVAFANAYTPRFFLERPRWVSATTVAVEAAGLQFRNIDDLMAENAIYQDFSNVFLIEGGFQLEERSPERAGEILARIGAENSFTLYEYFITDKIGHDQNFEAARRTLPLLARFVRSLLERTDLQRTTVILTSDHGNVEDLSTRNHTLNKVPTLVWGKDRFQIADKIGSLSDISPAIVTALTLSTVE